MSAKYIVSHFEQQLGPFDEAEVRSKLERGEILPIDYVYDEERKDWVLVAEKFPWAAAIEFHNPIKPKAETVITQLKDPVETKTLEQTTPITPPPLRPDILKRLRTSGSPINPNTVVGPTQTLTPAPPATSVNPALFPNYSTASDIDPSSASVSPEIEKPDLVPQPKADPKPNLALATTSIRVETPATYPAATAAISPTSVQLVNGQAEVHLPPHPSGRFEVVLKDSTTLKLDDKVQIQIRSVDPVELKWMFPIHQVVGQEVDLHFSVIDEHGGICPEFSGEFTLRIHSSADPAGDSSKDQEIPIHVKFGQALVKLQHTKAETWKMSLTSQTAKPMKLPTERWFEWMAGPATRLILDGPMEFLAGQPMRVQVKAVDNFGNLAKNFQGTVILEVKAS